jgi:hypothetical protein
MCLQQQVIDSLTAGQRTRTDTSLTRSPQSGYTSDDSGWGEEPFRLKEGAVVTLQLAGSSLLLFATDADTSIPMDHLTWIQPIQPLHARHYFVLEHVRDNRFYLCSAASGDYIAMIKNQLAYPHGYVATLSQDAHAATHFTLLPMPKSHLVRIIGPKRHHLICAAFNHSKLLATRSVLAEAEGLFIVKTINKSMQ